VTAQRRIVLTSAFDAHPERFVRDKPQPPAVPAAAWINRPKVESKQVELGEKIQIPGVFRYGSGEDRRSSRVLEAES
jgi:hypothetical protein